MSNSSQDWPLTTIFGTAQATSSAPTEPTLSPNQKKRVLLCGLCKVAGSFALILGAGTLLLDGYATYRIHEQLTSWPHVQALIVSNEIYAKELHSSGADTVSTPSTVYGYQWLVRYPAKTHVFQTTLDIGYQKGTRDAMLEWLGRYPDGSYVTVVYDPGNPAHVRLAEDTRSSYAPVLATTRFIAWALGIGLLLILISEKIWSTRQASSAADVGAAVQVRRWYQ